MYSKRLKRRESFIRARQETKRKRIPWGKYFYLAALVLIMIGFVKLGYERVAYIEGMGIIEAKTISIESGLTARITAIEHKIKDRVYEKEPMVFLDRSELENKIEDKERKVKEKNNTFMREIIELKNELKLLEKNIKNREKEIKDIKAEHKRAKDLLALEVITLPQLLDIEHSLKSAEEKVSILSIRHELAKTELAAIKKEYVDHRKSAKIEIEQLNGILKKTVLLAPLEGMVMMIYKQKGEMAQAGEPIIKISDVSEKFIKAYFEGPDEGAVQLAEEVLVVFENGDRSKGKIRKIYPGTLYLPPEYRPQYGPKKRLITAEIVPINGESWNRIIGTKAKVLVTSKHFHGNIWGKQ